MLTLDKFTGINNVLPGERLTATELASAVNVDIGLRAEVKRRQGYTEVLSTCHKNLHQAPGFMLATVDGGNLVAIAPSGERTTIYFSLGTSRVWYTDLPDGRTTFSNGLVCGITDGVTYTTWGVPAPSAVGAAASTAGDLFPGRYRYQTTHVRLSDGLESGASYAPWVDLTGGISITGLPVLPGHATNVYLTGADGDAAFLAGTTMGDSFAYDEANDALVLPCRTEFLEPAPPGRLTAFWRGRVLTAVGPVLYASRANQVELFDRRKDFRQFTAPIVLVQPVDDGVYVGTEKELAFLSGDSFDSLTFRAVLDGPVVLGSGVSAPGDKLLFDGEPGRPGTAMMCIAARKLVAGGNGGVLSIMTAGRYETDVSEVAATFRVIDGVPQYIAIPQ